MPLPALFLPILAAAAAQAPALPNESIVVTGHPWAPFISPMGEPFRAHFRTDDTFVKWFRQADRDGDGILSSEEMQADADRFFAKLDVNHDGEIDPEELIQYEWDVAPEIQVNSRWMRAPGEAPPKEIGHGRGDNEEFAERTRGRSRGSIDHGPQGAGRYALLNIPEPVAAADANFDRSISLAEFRQAAIQRFRLLDTGRAGRISLAQLQALIPKAGARQKHRLDDLDARIGSPLPPGN